MRVAELKIAGLNQFQKHIGVAIETGSCVVGGAEPVAGLQIGSAKCIEIDDIFGVLNREFTPLDRGIAQSQRGSIERLDGTGRIAAYDVRFQRLIRPENHTRILAGFDDLRFALFVELCIDLAAGEPLMRFT